DQAAARRPPCSVRNTRTREPRYHMAEMDSGSLAGSVLGHYRVDALIGRGGMGEVYRGHDTTLDRAVALKVLAANVVGNADSLARFIQEARTASALNHPHLVAILSDRPSRSDSR